MVKSRSSSTLPFYLNTAILALHIFIAEYYHDCFFILWVVYTVIPILDQIIPPDTANPSPEDEKILKHQLRWKIPIYLFIFMEWVVLFWSFSYITRYQLSWLNYFAFLLALSHVSAIGFLFSHEIMHKKATFEKFVGTFDMLKNLYMHFYSEHLFGHHKYVSTPDDPATAKINQSLYSFIPQSIIGSLVNTWKREGDKMVKQKKSIYSIENRMIQWIIIEVCFTVAIGILFGRQCLYLFLLHVVLSDSLLETINYIRHYGLLRKKMKNGDYEQVTPKHSWNAPQTVQNYILLNLQRHSDHHANSYKPYQILQSVDDAPNLPCGYAVCVAASLVPWAWFSIVNPLVETTNQGKLPNEEVMKKSTDALRFWLVLQIAVNTCAWILIRINS